jgi:osmoprotectant transport system substrate-binding protein
VFKPWGYNNTYALVMRKDRADELGIKKTSDLAKYADKLTIATDPTWQNYPGQGYKEWQNLYGFKFSKAPEMDYGLLYRAVSNKDVDTAMAYSTDGRIKSLNLVVIDDDKQFNPPYHGVLVMRNETKDKYPDVYQLLTQLEGKFTTEEMIGLNAQADVDGKEPGIVARDWLKAKGLL